jgi:hypothetical protein
MFYFVRHADRDAYLHRTATVLAALCILEILQDAIN